MEWTPTRIRKLRESLDMTRDEFANAMDVHVTTVMSWEAGRHEAMAVHFKNFEAMERKAKERKHGKK